jgi:hypothetical protein
MHFTLADMITDITQNASEAGADLVELEVREGGGQFRFLVRDNGRGMTKEELSRAVDPFVTDGVKHPHRKVGLGIPFLIQTAEQSGGGWEIRSAKAGHPAAVLKSDGVSGNETPAPAASSELAGGAGTAVTAWFETANVDTPPAGDLPGMFRTILMFEGPAEVRIRRLRNGGGAGDLEYEVRRSELADALGDLEDTGSLVLLDKYLRSLEEDE